MPKLSYFAELSAEGITYLAWAAGLAQGAGNIPAAQSLQNILASIQAVELPDEDDEPEEGQWEDDGGAVLPLFPEEETPEGDAERTPDPAFVPPAPTPPLNNQGDFGAGPPPGGLV